MFLFLVLHQNLNKEMSYLAITADKLGVFIPHLNVEYILAIFLFYGV